MRIFFRRNTFISLAAALSFSLVSVSYAQLASKNGTGTFIDKKFAEGNVITTIQEGLAGVGSDGRLDNNLGASGIVKHYMKQMALDNQTNQLPAGSEQSQVTLYTGPASSPIDTIKSGSNANGELVVTMKTTTPLPGLKGAVFRFYPITYDGAVITGGASQDIARWDCSYTRGATVSSKADYAAFQYSVDLSGAKTINILPILPYPFNLCSAAAEDDDEGGQGLGT